MRTTTSTTITATITKATTCDTCECDRRLIDVVALVGDRVLLKATFIGLPQPIVTWTRAGHVLKNDERTSITTSKEGVSCLLLQNITTDDSGKYDVCVENEFGTDAHYSSVSVEGPPDPPSGKPCLIVESARVTVTWSSSPYDGGRKVTSFAVEYSLLGSDIWTIACPECQSLWFTVRGLQPGGRYVFRVRANNVHGSSMPSQESDVLQMEEQNESSSFEPRLVSLEPGSEFKRKYEILEELGKGSYGVVHKVIDKKTSQKLAAKIIRCRNAKDRDKVNAEIDVMNLLRHPKLLQLAAAFENPKEMVIVTEYISGGELFERVVADDFTLTEKDCILFMKQICEGVAYMHSQNIVHLDLKPENIMCHTRTSHEIKIIDFGLAQKLDPEVPVRVLFGTPEFTPPEIINYEPIGPQSDMWSLGVICYVLLSGLSPFMGDNNAETFANITRADYDFEDVAFNAVSQNARDFIGALLNKRKEDRMSAEESLRHCWLDPDSHKNRVVICTDKLKKFIIRRKWQKTGNAIRALGRMATLSATRRNSTTNSSFKSTTAYNHNKMMTSVNEETTTTTSSSTNSNKTVVRGKNLSERSDSGISDCYIAATTQSCTSTPLMGKKQMDFGAKQVQSTQNDNETIGKINFKDFRDNNVQNAKITDKTGKDNKLDVSSTTNGVPPFKGLHSTIAPKSLTTANGKLPSVASAIRKFDQLDRMASGAKVEPVKKIVPPSPSLLRKPPYSSSINNDFRNLNNNNIETPSSLSVQKLKSNFEKGPSKSDRFKKVSDFWNNPK